MASFFGQNYMEEVGPVGEAPPPPGIRQCLDNLTDEDYLVKDNCRSIFVFRPIDQSSS